MRYLRCTLILLLFLAGCELLDLFTPRQNPLVDEDCRPIPEKFNAEWKKYSDLDAAIPVESRSSEAQGYHAQETEIAQLSADIFTLKRDYEVVKELVSEMQQYYIALKAGHKANLIKVTVRMAYITYNTIDSASGSGKLYSEFLTGAEENGVKLFGKAIKFSRSVIPSQSGLAINTSTLGGKVASVATTGLVETLASYGDPVEITKEVLQASKDQIMPGAELSDPELQILKQEHLEIKKVDQMIQLSNKANLDRLWQIREKEATITKLKAELWESEIKEKDRVRNMLVSECKRNKKDE